MPITGSLEEASLPDVLQLLCLARKTGCLSITDRQRFGRIFLKAGRVIFATVVNRPDRLGDMLVNTGTISRAQLDEAMARQSRHGDRKLGEILLELGRICRADLEQSLRKQIEDAVYTVLGWSRGRFAFQQHVLPENQDLVVSLDADALMLEGARRIDEWSVIEKKIPSFGMVFQLARERLEASNAVLTAEQQQIIDLIDGERDLHQIVVDAGLLEFDVAKAVYGLTAAGFARPIGRGDAQRAPHAVNVECEEQRALGMAFYRAGMLDESKRAFTHASTFAPANIEASFHLGLIAYRECRFEDAIQHFEHAATCDGPQAAVLHNLALCYEAVGRTLDAETHARDAAERAPDDASILTGRGIIALNRGDESAAIQHLDRARLACSLGAVGPMWHWARSLAAAASNDYRAAERILRQGLEEAPGHPVLRNNLAVLLELHGEFARAESVLTRTVADDSFIPQVSKNIGDLAYRRARYEEAWDAYQRAIRLRPGLGGDVYYRLGAIAMKRSHPDLARQYWQRALELDPEHAQARAKLGTSEPVGARQSLGVGG